MSVIEHELFEVGTRYRIYLEQSHRRRIGLQGSGYGSDVAVGFVTVPERDGDVKYGSWASTTVTIRSRSEFTIPVRVREQLPIDVGDVVHCTIRRV